MHQPSSADERELNSGIAKLQHTTSKMSFC
jgi:hypothetical protein